MRFFARLTLTWSTLCVLAGLAAGAEVSTNLDSYALFAIDELRANSVNVASGSVGVNAGRFVGTGPIDAAGSSVIAGDVRLNRRSHCGQLFANNARGTAPGCSSPVSFSGPIVASVLEACAYPLLPPNCNSLVPIVVARGDTRVLDPGRYGRLTVGARATLTLTGGGRYDFCDVRTGRGGVLEIQSPTEIDVAGNLRLGTVRYTGAVPPAADPAVFQSASPFDVRFFTSSTRVFLTGDAVLRHLCAPIATLSAQRGATLTGSFAARVIRLRQVTVGLAPSGPPLTTTPSTVPPTTTRTASTSTATTSTSSSSSTTSTTLPTAPTFVGLIGSERRGPDNTHVVLTVSPSGVTAGDSILVAFASNPVSIDQPVSCADDAGNVYHVDADAVVGAGTAGARVIVCSAHHVAGLGAGQTITITHPATAVREVSALEFSGLAGTLETPAFASGSGKSLTAVTAPFTVSQPNTLLLGVIGTELPPQRAITAGAGWLSPDGIRSSERLLSVFPEFRVAAPGTYVADATLELPHNWAAVIVGYR